MVRNRVLLKELPLGDKVSTQFTIYPLCVRAVLRRLLKFPRPHVGGVWGGSAILVLCCMLRSQFSIFVSAGSEQVLQLPIK